MDRREKLDDPEESLRLALDEKQAEIWTALPGIVTAVNLSAQTVSIQPAVRGKVFNEAGASSTVNLPILVDVPIVWPRAGGFALTFPVAVGDEVLVIFASRCIDGWWQSGGISNAAEVRMHDLSDGFAVLAPTSQPKKLSSVSASNVQLRNDAGSTFVEITPDGKINLTASAELSITAPSVKITGPITQTGGAVSLGGVVFGTHVHGGIVPGGGTTSGPQ